MSNQDDVDGDDDVVVSNDLLICRYRGYQHLLEKQDGGGLYMAAAAAVFVYVGCVPHHQVVDHLVTLLCYLRQSLKMTQKQTAFLQH